MDHGMNGINIPSFSPNKNRQSLNTEKTSRQQIYETDEDSLKIINNTLRNIPKAQNILSIGNGVVLTGKVVEADQVVIHGSVEAEINANSVEVMVDGSLTGSIKTNMFSVSGNFTGNAQVFGALTIQKGGTIEGDVSYGSLSVENGGLLFGTLSKPENKPHQKPLGPTPKEAIKVQVTQ